MTRFALLSEFYPPDIGGIQSTLELFARSLGDDVTVIAPHVASDEQHIRRSLFSGTSRPSWWWLVSWFNSAKADGLELAIFGHWSRAVLAAGIAGIPFAIFVHGNDLLEDERRWYMRPIMNYLLRRARWIAVNSSFMANRVHHHGVPKARIVEAHPYVSANRVLLESRSAVAGRKLVTAARLVKRKNITTLLDVVSQLRKAYPDCTLDVIGDGPEREALEQKAQELGIGDAVTFHGFIDEDEKWKLLSHADVFIMTPTIEAGGRDIEGFGLVYIEASAVGLPVIGSDTGGIRDAIADGVTGFLVQSNDTDAIVKKVAQLFDVPSDAHRIGEQGRQRVLKEFTDTVRVARLKQLIISEQQHKVSIIIPAYQAASTIAATLQSVQSQTYKNIDIIVVDDGSTDDLAAALKPFASSVKYIRQENGGAPQARNTGFDASHGDYVIFLDADIVLESKAIEHMVRALDAHPKIDMVYSDFTFGWKKFHLHEYSVSDLKKMNYIHTSSLMRRSAFPRFDETLKRFQDWDLWLTMAEHKKQAMWIPEMLFTVTQRDQKIGMSAWVPSFVYRLPFIGQGKGNKNIAKYREAERVIREKHGLHYV